MAGQGGVLPLTPRDIDSLDERLIFTIIKSMEEKKKKKSRFGLGLLVGGIAGAVAGLLFAPKKGKETRKETAEKIFQLKEWLKEKEIDKKVAKFWGKTTKEGKEIYLLAKERVIIGLAEVKGALEQIDKNKYVKVVEKAIDDVRRGKKVPVERLEKLKRIFLADWEKIKKNVGPNKRQSR